MKKFFTDNIFLKVASLILAVALWFYVTSTGQSEIKMEIPLTLINVPENLVVVKQKQKTVSIKVRGHFRILEDIRPSDITVSANLKEAKEKSNKIRISDRDIRLPSIAKVTHLAPTTVDVYLENKSSTTVKVKPSISGSPNENFYIKEISVKPDMVIAEGAHSVLKKLRSLRTRHIDISGATEDVVQEVTVDTADKDVTVVNEKVTVTVVIEEKTGEKK